MRDRDLLMEWLPPALAALAIAAIIHILAILAVPRPSTMDTWARLSDAGPLNRFTLIERDDSGALPLPFEDPRTFIAVCKFDVRNGPVRVRADFTTDGLVVMSFHDRRGATFYGLTDRGGLRGRLDALIVTPEQLAAIDEDTPDDEPVQELRLSTPTPEGFVIARSLAIDMTDEENARRRLAGMTCATQSNR